MTMIASGFSLSSSLMWRATIIPIPVSVKKIDVALKIRIQSS